MWTQSSQNDTEDGEEYQGDREHGRQHAIGQCLCQYRRPVVAEFGQKSCLRFDFFIGALYNLWKFFPGALMSGTCLSRAIQEIPVLERVLQKQSLPGYIVTRKYLLAHHLKE